MTLYMTANIMYVLYWIEANEMGVIMTTMQWSATIEKLPGLRGGNVPIKLKIQFADVESALAEARIRNGTISAGYSLEAVSAR